MSDIVTRIKSRFDHTAARKVLQEKYHSRMLFAHSGGMWRAGPELLTTLLTCPDDHAVILDIYQNPVEIDTKELYALAQQRWQEQMTAWLIEWTELQRQR
jgi:hypothetical protein